MICYRNEIASIHYFEEESFGMSYWEGDPSDLLYKNALKAALKVIEENQLSDWLVDLKNLKGIDPDLQEWTYKVWMPKAYNKGLEHFAIVLPKDIHGKMSTHAIISKYDEITSCYFNDVEDAKKWIFSIRRSRNRISS